MHGRQGLVRGNIYGRQCRGGSPVRGRDSVEWIEQTTSLPHQNYSVAFPSLQKLAITQNVQDIFSILV